jgi:hypothetical protein
MDWENELWLSLMNPLLFRGDFFIRIHTLVFFVELRWLRYLPYN